MSIWTEILHFHLHKLDNHLAVIASLTSLKHSISVLWGSSLFTNWSVAISSSFIRLHTVEAPLPLTENSCSSSLTNDHSSWGDGYLAHFQNSFHEKASCKQKMLLIFRILTTENPHDTGLFPLNYVNVYLYIFFCYYYHNNLVSFCLPMCIWISYFSVQ